MCVAKVQEVETYPGAVRLAIFGDPAKPLIQYMECITTASITFNLDEIVLISLLLVEDGYLAPVRENNNGTFDHGFGQINSVRRNEIEVLGFTLEELAHSPCKNIMATAYLLKQEINQADDYWTGVANYHYDVKGKYPKNHFRYKGDVFQQYLSLVSIAQSVVNQPNIISF
jgi:hypothetical protein|tara:strand:+ start:1862 stop:2374 length:513 start_codon:yes stop_codon:yes gene_type:complete